MKIIKNIHGSHPFSLLFVGCGRKVTDVYKRQVLAIRDNEIAAESCGIQTTYYKVMAFAFPAAFAGLAGGLYAC